MTTPRSRPRSVIRASARTGGIAAIIAALCYSSFLLSWWTHAAPSASGGFVSELEAPGQPYAWLYRSSDVLAGLGILTTAWAVRPLIAGHRWSSISVVLLALAGAGSIMDGMTSMQCDPAGSARCAQHEHTVGGLVGQLAALHTDSGLLGFAASAAGAILLGAVLADRWAGWGRLQIALGIGMAGCGVADLIMLLAGRDIGSTERVRVLLTSGWFLTVGLFLFRAHATSRNRHPHSRPADDLAHGGTKRPGVTRSAA
jgi:Protein of unknown function (DUF998)